MDGFRTVWITDAITQKIKDTLPSTQVDEDGVVDNANLPRTTDGQLIPYVVPRYGSARRELSDTSFAGVRKDSFYGTVDVSCIAPTGRMSRQMLDYLVDALLGFKPTGMGEMWTEGLPDNFPIMNDMSRPTAFVSSIRFRYTINGNDTSNHISH
jgi:hypothetical protein